MSKSLRFIAANLVAALISCTAFAQSVTIKGTVTNSTSKEGVPAVSVTIKGTSQGTYTDDKGVFSISTTSKFPLTLSLSSVGFEGKEVNVNSASDVLDISFVEISTLGQEVVMAANRTPQRILESPVTVERLSSSALRNSAVPSYYEAIANLKGVDMHTASLTFRTVTTRGFVASGNNRLNQLIDGMDNQAPGLNFSVGNIVGLTELDVDNIELLSGASSALYGSGGMNGTLLLNSKNPFKYTGLSFNVKQGIMHTDGNQRKASPYYNWSMRWAKNFNNKLAFKFAWELLKAEDWQANDYRNAARTGVLSQLKDGNRITDPNYDGINVYGDETSARLDFINVATGAQAQFAAGLAAAGVPNIVPTLNAIIPSGSTFAQIQTILNSTFVGPAAAALPTINQMLPFYLGLRNNWYQNNQLVSRTGYNERDLVDYGALNFKFTAGLHYKITPGIEASWNTYWGTGTTVYTGADRYSLRNFKMAQHRLEIRHKNWFVRGYTTQENAGEAYQATALGRLMQEAFKPSQSVWYPQYVTQYFTYALSNFAATNNAPSPFNAHASARSVADAGIPLPGSTTFNALKEKIRSTPIGQGGSKFLDKSDLWSGEGQLNISDALHFSDKVEIIAGVQWKQWVMNSQGTIFADSAGAIKISETGGYMQLRKKLFNDVLTLTGAIRYDVQTNFDGRWTPRLTGVVKVAKDNYLRASFQTAYRFPTNQDQYIDLFTGSVTLIGTSKDFITRYGLNTNTFTAQSVQSGGPLVAATINQVKPETVSSYEIGYKGLIGKKLLVDFYGYFSRYKDFFARVAAVKGFPSPFDPLTARNYAYIQNSPDAVKATGWGLGLEYQLPKGFVASGNVFSDKLRDLPKDFISFFNAPKYRFNVGLRNDNICKNIGFNITTKWQGETYYEGTFITGTLPSFFWVDAQVSYKMPKSKSLIRIGGSNLGNTYRRTGFGSPYIGGLYYISYGYNL